MVNFSGWTKRLLLLCVWPALTACIQSVAPAPALNLDRAQASRQEVVTAKLTGLSAAEARVTVAGLEAEVLERSEVALAFALPEDSPAGPQTVRVEADGRFATAALTVLGDDALSGRATLLLVGELSEAELSRQLQAVNPAFRLLSLRPLNTGALALEPGHPCLGLLAEVELGDTPPGEALEQLKALEQDNSDITWIIDPATDFDLGALSAVDHLGAVGARLAQGRGLGGTGTLIAILDTGVNEHPELTGRLRLDLAFNALNGSNDVTDGYSTASAGHGTPVAVLAAGATLGVAPQAEVLPVKVCADDGSCRSSDVILGSCHALVAAQQDEKLDALVLNYSLGGETELQALKIVMNYALGKKVLIAAAGGNQGDPRAFPQPAPRHYPAASDLEGLVAVAALSAGEALECVTFESIASVTPDAPFTVGDSFSEGSTTVTLKPFTQSDGSPSREGSAYASFGSAGGSSAALWTNNIVTSFDFGMSVGGLSLNFGDYGGNENLNLNGEALNVGALGELPMSVAGVQVAASGAGASGQGVGDLTLLGPVTSFGIGGQEFALDDVCPIQGAEADWQPAIFSTRGDYLDLAAPGEGVTSGTPSGALASYQGTSFAAPLVAGALALWREAEPAMSPTDIETTLKAEARALPYPAEAVGAGMLELSAKP